MPGFDTARETGCPVRQRGPRMCRARLPSYRHLRYWTAMNARRIPSLCPSCGHQPVAEILYGKLLLTEKLQADLEAGKVVVGEHFYSEGDPEWRCIKCGQQGGQLGQS